MVSFPVCKINLGLQVLRKREDGYHDIETCFYPIPFTDILEIIPHRPSTFAMTGLSVPGAPENNLVLKAYMELKNKFGAPDVAMHLHKRIPMGAGLGGGSSDAAFAIRLIKSISNLSMTHEQEHSIAKSLGSDCPYFLYDGPMMGRGRGEQLTSIPLSIKKYYIVIVKPDIHISTADAYQQVIPDSKRPGLDTILRLPVAQWADRLFNDFEVPVFKKHTELKMIKDKLYAAGAVYASLSGSGAALYGIFERAPALDQLPVLWQGYPDI